MGVEHRLGVAIALAAALLLGLSLLLLEPLRAGVGDAVRGDADSLRERLDRLGAAGVAAVLGLALMHAFVWYPAEILDAAVGFTFGLGPGLPLVMAGWLANGVLCHWIGHRAARPALMRAVGGERFARYERAIERGGVALLLAMRLIPIVPFSLFSYVAGSARVPLARFAWTTAVGYLPITVLFVWLGSRLEELSPTDPVLWVGAAVLIALLLASRRALRLLTGEGEAGQAPRPPGPRPPLGGI